MEDKVLKYVNVVESAHQNAELGKSKITDSILAIPGMSGNKTRHFLNNVVSSIGNRYLEIGVWQGSTFCSALYKSTTNKYCVAVDNWSEFGGPKNEFLANLQKFIDLDNIKVTFVEKDYRMITSKDLLIEKFGKFAIYLYDGPHHKVDQYDGLKKYIDYLEDDFVFLCDDWNWTKDVEVGTREAIKDLGVTVHKEWVMKTPNNIDNDKPGWWNGYYAAVCSK